MLFSSVVDISILVAGTSKRLLKIDLLAGLLKKLPPPDEIEIVVSFCRARPVRVAFQSVHPMLAQPFPGIENRPRRTGEPTLE